MRSVPGPFEVERVEAALVERLGAAVQPVDVLPPGGDGVGLVQPDGAEDGLPHAVEVGLAQRRVGPAQGRAADDAPVHLAARDVRQEDRLLLAHAGARDPRAVRVVEELRIGMAANGQVRAALAEAAHALDRPARARRRARRRAPGPRRCGARTRPRRGRPRTGPLLVRDLRDGPHQRGVLDERADAERLPGLEVQSDLDDQACVGVERSVLRLHGLHSSDGRTRGHHQTRCWSPRPTPRGAAPRCAPPWPRVPRSRASARASR